MWNRCSIKQTVEHRHSGIYIHEHLTQAECLNVAHFLFYGKLYYYKCLADWYAVKDTDEKNITIASNSCLRATFGYKIKDISTKDLHIKADVLTPNQKSFFDKAVMFWRIVNNCEPHEHFMDLLFHGSHNTQKQNLYMHQSNQGMIGKFASRNRLYDIIPLLCDNWLRQKCVWHEESLKGTNPGKNPAKWLNCDWLLG